MNQNTETESNTIALSVSYHFHDKQAKDGKTYFGEDWVEEWWTQEQIVAHVRSGKALCVSVVSGGNRCKENFVSSQLIGLDLDTGTMSIDELAQIPLIRDYAFFIGETASSTLEHPRIRVYFVLNKPIYDVVIYEGLVLRLQEEFERQGIRFDRSCKDASRFYYGAAQKRAIEQYGKVLPLTVMDQLLPAKREQVTMPTTNVVLSPCQYEGNDSYQSYALTALRNECAIMRSAPEGNRNNQLNISAYNTGQFVIIGLLNEAEVIRELTNAAQATGLPDDEIERTIQSGLAAGKRNPRDLSKIPHRVTFSHIQGAEMNEPVIVAHITDDMMGDDYIAQQQDNLRFFHGKFHRYIHGYWKSVEEEQIQREIWKILKKFKPYNVSPTMARMKSVLSYVCSSLSVPQEQVNQFDHYINLINGLYNLKTHSLEPHNRDLYLTSQLAFEYNPTAKCPIWDSFLQDVLVEENGVCDPSLMDLLHEAIGYSLTSSTRFEKAFWLFGPGASGKTTILKVIERLSGDAYAHTDLTALDKDQFAMSELLGKLVAFISEISARAFLPDHRFKQLVTGEMMRIRMPYRQGTQAKLFAKLWLSSNVLPENADTSNAVYRRIAFIPLRRTIPEADRDPDLLQSLLKELPGIFNLALEGLKRLDTTGRFTYVAQSQLELDRYANDNDPEKNFLNDEEWIIRDQLSELRASDLHQAYKCWCERNGFKPKKSTGVARDWERLGLTKVKNNYILYQGIDLTDHARHLAGLPPAR